MAMIRNARMTGAIVFGWLGLMLIVCGCHRHSDAALQQRLVGTWRYAGSEGNSNTIFSDLTFTVSASGNYTSQITTPRTGSIEGTAEIKKGVLVITATKRNNTNVIPPLVERQTIIQFDEGEFVTRSEGSTVKNHFKKLERIRNDGDELPGRI
jgi:hypothetical protein